MDRRTFLALIAASPALAGEGLAQPGKSYRLAFLSTTDEQSLKAFFLDAFLAGLADLGYTRGANFTLEIRYARGDMSRLPALASELIALKPDVLLGIEPAALALRRATSVVPIVLVGSSDPVAAGLVKSLARPGTNVTGMAHLYHELVAKQIELLMETAPGMSRVGLLQDPPQTGDRLEHAARAAAKERKADLVRVSVQDPAGVPSAFERFKAEGVQGVVVGPSGTMVFLRREIMKQAARFRLPLIYAQSDVPRDGGLMSYGADLPYSYRRDVPRFVDRILKGEKTAEMAVQQTTKYELVVNLKAAAGIGLSIPRSVLLRADQVIQ